MIEEAIEKHLFSAQTEKSFIDKLLAKEDISEIRRLMVKERLTRSELLNMLYMCLSSESKLWNFGEYDRYVVLKFFVWIQEFIKYAEMLFDYKDYLEQQKKKYVKISRRTWQLLDNATARLEHNCKFLIDLYLNIGRTSLSLGGTGFLELLKNKYEVSYPHMQQVQTPLPQQQVETIQHIGGKTK